MKYHPRTKPFKHQARATLKAARQRNHAVFFEPRLGKSKAAIDWVGVLALKGEVRRVVIFSPKIALEVWEEQLHEHFPYNAHVETFEEEWDLPSRNYSEPRVRWFLAGREETFRAERVGKKLVRRKQSEIETWDPDAIVVDESHEYKRPGGRGAQDAWRLVSRLRLQRAKAGKIGPHVLLLSGTPNPKGWRDVFAQFRIMDPTILGTNAGDFDEEYCVYGQGPRKYTVIRYRNLKRLERIIHAHSTVCTAVEAGLEGKLFFQTLDTDLPQRVRDRYNEMAEEFVTEVDGQVVTAKNAGVKRLRLLQITGGFLTDGTQLHHAKLDTTKEWLSLLHEQGEHVVVYARFTAEVIALEKLCRSLKFSTYRVDSSTRRERATYISEFQKAKSPAAIVAQVQALSQAVELTNAAEVVYYGLPDGWVDFFQAMNRVRGPNQHRPVRVTAICARNTLDRNVFYSLQMKEDIHATLMRNPHRFLFNVI